MSATSNGKRWVLRRGLTIVLIVAVTATACGGGDGIGSLSTTTTRVAPESSDPVGDGRPLPEGIPQVEVEAIVVSEEPGQPTVLQLAPGDHGVTAVEISTDRESGVDQLTVWDGSQSPSVVTAVGSIVTIEDADVGLVTVELGAEEATVEWITLAGDQGSEVVSLHDAGSAVPPTPNAMPASYRPGSVEPNEPSESIGRVSGVAVVTYRVDHAGSPTPLALEVDPCPVPFAVGEVTITCRGSGIATGPRGRFEVVFEATVPIRTNPLDALDPSQRSDVLRRCEDDLNATSSTFAGVASGLGVLGLLGTFVSAPVGVAIMIGGAAVAADGVSRYNSPASVAEECSRRLVAASLDPAAARQIRFLTVDGLSVEARPLLGGVIVEPPVKALPPVTPFDGSRPKVDAGTFSVVDPDTTTTTSSTTTTTTTPPRPTELVVDDIAFIESSIDGSLRLQSQASLSIEYDDDMQATIGGSVQGNATWDVTFLCFFDAENLAEPTGDQAEVRYSLSYGAGFTAAVQAADDGSFSVETQYRVPYSVDFTLTEGFSAECQHLNGDPAPGIGGDDPIGLITITVDGEGRVTLGTRWRGPGIYEDPGVPADNARRIEGEGVGQGTIIRS